MVKMFPFQKVTLVGVALEGMSGSPLIVFEGEETDRFLPLETDPFDIDFLIREIIGEGEDTAAAWVTDLIRRKRPTRALLTSNDEGEPRLVISGSRIRGLPKAFRLGEGLVIARRLKLEIVAHPELFHRCEDQLEWMADHGTFREDFLFLDPAISGVTAGPD